MIATFGIPPLGHGDVLQRRESHDQIARAADSVNIDEWIVIGIDAKFEIEHFGQLLQNCRQTRVSRHDMHFVRASTPADPDFIGARRRPDNQAADTEYEGGEAPMRSVQWRLAQVSAASSAPLRGSCFPGTAIRRW